MSLYQGITSDNIAELIKFRQAQHTLSIELMNKIKQWNTDMTTILEQYHLTVIEGQKPYHILNDVIERKTVEVCLDISGDKYNNAMTTEQDQELVKVLDEHQLMIVKVKADRMLIDGCYCVTVAEDISSRRSDYRTDNEIIKDYFGYYPTRMTKADGYQRCFLVSVPKSDQNKFMLLNSNMHKYYTNNQYKLLKIILPSLINSISLIYCEQLDLGFTCDINKIESKGIMYNSSEQQELSMLIIQTGLNNIKGIVHDVFPGLKELLPDIQFS